MGFLSGFTKNLQIFGETGAPKELCSNGVSKWGPQRALLEWGVRVEARVACRLSMENCLDLAIRTEGTAGSVVPTIEHGIDLCDHGAEHARAPVPF